MSSRSILHDDPHSLPSSNATNLQSDIVSSLEVSSIKDDFVRWYLRTFPLSTEPRRWHYQNRYVRGEKNDWYEVKRRAVDEASILRHLDPSDEYWIASRCPIWLDVPTTSFILLDFDCDKRKPIEEGRAVAWERVSRVTAYIGKEYSPLIFTSPSGGYHVYYFLDRPTPLHSLVSLRRPKVDGLVPDVIRAAIGAFGNGTCEMYPLKGNVVRWPMGSLQYWVDGASGLAMLGVDRFAMRSCIEAHRRDTAPLTVAYLSSIRPAVNHAVRRKKAALDAGVTEAQIEAAIPHALTLHPTTVAKAAMWYEKGLIAPGTRNEATFTIALAMHHAHSALVPLGFNPDGNIPEQLFAWLRTKHNGMSAQYAGPTSGHDSYWLSECHRVAESAANVRVAANFQEGMTLLREAEWELALETAQHLGRDKRERFRLFVVAACLLRKGKWSFYGSSRAFTPFENGRFPGEVHHRWIRQIPFCRELASFKHYRDKLVESAYMTIESKADYAGGRATIYGFQFLTDSPRHDLGYSPADLRDALNRIEGVDRLDRASFEVALYLAHRFATTELEAAFGKGAVAFVEKRVSLIRTAMNATDGVLTKAA